MITLPFSAVLSATLASTDPRRNQNVTAQATTKAKTSNLANILYRSERAKTTTTTRD